MFIADFHIHSKYSRATSRDMDVNTITKWARLKGIDLVGTGDFTHPDWLRELESSLGPSGEDGIYARGGALFMLTVEVSNIYSKNGKTRKVHNILFCPSFETARGINKALAPYGTLASDGRPMLGLDCEKMVKMLVAIDPRIAVVPAHAWTPHFGVFGSASGFDSLQACFGSQAEKIFSVETGLSSDPPMNRRLPSLDRICLISNSDAHSPAKLGREANVFAEKADYDGLIAALSGKNKENFLFTVEFFPEEGKYHWDGHRACGARLSPAESRAGGFRCPVCGKKVTVGVMQRVESLAGRPDGFAGARSPGFRRLVPLLEIVASALGKTAASKAVRAEYMNLVSNIGTEFDILLNIPEEELRGRCPENVVRGIANARAGNIGIEPGYDGEYGKISVFPEAAAAKKKQAELFERKQ